ncbi:glycosyltransferase family 71 protein [Xylaria intraflava]|nr:glycosyltransferase family 71 protein [Xylaria intraflava]
MLSVKSPSGPKEGRFPPGLLSPAPPDRRRRYLRRRRQIILFTIVLLSFIVYSTFFRPGVLERLEGYRSTASSSLRGMNSPVSEATYKQDDRSSQFVARKEPRSFGAQNPVTGTSAKNRASPKAPGPENPVVKAPIAKETEKQTANIQKLNRELEKEESGSDHWGDRPNLGNDLKAAFALLPDELTTRELLRPIDDGGASRMRELGLRTRAYGKYLRAWEKLHLVTDEQTGETYIRDDVIQYLRGTGTQDTSLDMSLSSTIHSYETFRSFLAGLSRLLFPFTTPYFADHMTLHAQFKNGGRGIVLTAGDGQAHYLLTTIYALREIGCELPIEIMYLGDMDLGEDHRVELENLPGVTTRDISQMVDDRGWKLAGWAIKPFAMLMSSFREVIFIDADSFFFRDPAQLFDDADYVDTGALFFRDRTIMPESKRRWLLQVLPRPIPKLAKESSWWKGTSGHHQESGVVVIDKWRHFVSMLLVCRFNGSDRDGRPGKTGVYEMMHGDKETFWIGFLLAGDESFAFHRGAVGIMGTIKAPNTTETNSTARKRNPSPEDNDIPPEDDLPLDEPEPDVIPDEDPAPENYTICSPQLLHLDLDGSPLWFNGWLLVSKYAEPGNRRFTPMATYLTEPRPARASAAADDAVWTPARREFWELAEDNMCCLTAGAESKFDIGAGDLELLAMMRARAVEVGEMMV